MLSPVVVVGHSSHSPPAAGTGRDTKGIPQLYRNFPEHDQRLRTSNNDVLVVVIILSRSPDCLRTGATARAIGWRKFHDIFALDLTLDQSYRLVS